jgi:L-asparagine transporter-like permease
MPKIGAATNTSLVEKRVAITYIGTLRYLVVVLPWERFEKLPSAKWLSGR